MFIFWSRVEILKFLTWKLHLPTFYEIEGTTKYFPVFSDGHKGTTKLGCIFGLREGPTKFFPHYFCRYCWKSRFQTPWITNSAAEWNKFPSASPNQWPPYGNDVRLRAAHARLFVSIFNSVWDWANQCYAQWWWCSAVHEWCTSATLAAILSTASTSKCYLHKFC